MKNKELIRTIKFVLFSASAGLIEFGWFSLLTALTDWSYWPRYLIALVFSVLWNFTLNRNFTFKSACNVPIAMLKVALFYLVFTPASTILGNYLAENRGWNDFVVTLLNMGLNFVLEYLYDRFFVFKDTIDTNNYALKESVQKETAV
ncbi:MAG: GtrA family protein [Lachnospiraceae bacterium]|nr:GtrA family protein [Lachnospiraceae bacterium]